MGDRVESSLKRSHDLLSMERELEDLLRNSQLSQDKREAFQELLSSIFDLFQAPYKDGKTSLIDASTLTLYSKMQGLVDSLASLLVNDDDVTRMEVDSQLPVSENGSQSSEFSDGELGDESPMMPERMTRTVSQSSNTFKSRRTSLYLSRDKSFLKQSPSFSSRNLPSFQDTKYSSTVSPVHTKQRPQSMFVVETPSKPYNRDLQSYDQSQFDETIPRIQTVNSSSTSLSSARKRYSMRF